ncbi:efflux RND transporter periplasmic adaptor subunit [uncultured Megasphaera sp.]|uniref:efflux RND transporter periplasmic adaptor subunit n=1 Tax=uncultured Megasphaera sp. TaxID=165188 RepID=UPI00259AB5F2|nr:efflux RND transporter periplasmic adaptor subunit [uncultured Megasphaera sp.]
MKRTYKAAMMSLVFVLAAVLAGCGAPPGLPKGPIRVNTYTVTAETVPLRAEYSGTVAAAAQVPIRSRISGRVLVKFVQGGQTVRAGQPLFRLDSREYDAALAAALAEQAQASAGLANQKLNYHRYRALAAQDAAAAQAVTDREAAVRQQEAVVQANAAQVQRARDNVKDTIIYAPFSGKLSVDDVPVGTYVTAGSTALVTISSTNPVFVEFSLSEQEYLQWMKEKNRTGTWGAAVQLRLSDGSIYPYTGHIAQMDPRLNEAGGAIVVKAVFDNPQQLLIPGLYGTILLTGQTAQPVLLVPQRAVQQMLGKYFLSVLNRQGQVQKKEVQVGPKTGKFWVITSGVKAGDVVIVDGYEKAEGAVLAPHALTKADIERDTVS